MNRTVATAPRTGLVAGRARPEDLAEASTIMREVLEDDLGGYQSRWHRDLDDLRAAYLDRPGWALFVARDSAGNMVGTAGIRPCTLACPPNPEWLAERYNRPEVCQLVRVWISPRARRQGAARALTVAATDWAVSDGGYDAVYLHTDASVPGAEAFWRSMPTTMVHDARPDPHHTVHFELDVAATLRACRR